MHTMLKDLVIPAMISGAQGDLDMQLNRIKGKVKRVQLDIMDGRFVPRTSLFFDFRLPPWFEYEAHLMVLKPLEWIDRHYRDVSIVIMHVETLGDIPPAIAHAKKKGLKVFLSMKPETGAGAVLPYVGKLDGVQVMTEDPGSYCKAFLSEPLKKIKEVKKISPTIPVEVDGCMDPKTIKLAKQYGANLFVSGSYIHNSNDAAAAIKELQDAVTR